MLTRTLEGGGLNPYPGGGALTRTLGRGGLISDPHPRGGGALLTRTPRGGGLKYSLCGAMTFCLVAVHKNMYVCMYVYSLYQTRRVSRARKQLVPD